MESFFLYGVVKIKNFLFYNDSVKITEVVET